jgi:hypothetical protein
VVLVGYATVIGIPIGVDLMVAGEAGISAGVASRVAVSVAGITAVVAGARVWPWGGIAAGETGIAAGVAVIVAGVAVASPVL